MRTIVPVLPDGAIELRADADFDELQFAWRSGDGGAWQSVPGILDLSLLSDEASLSGLPNFTGAFVGMACQDLAGTAAPADFAFFRYEPRERAVDEPLAASR